MSDSVLSWNQKSADWVVDMQEPELVVLYGGESNESEISRLSGKAVYEALLKTEIRENFSCFDLQQNQLPKELESKGRVVLPMIHGAYGEDGQLQSELEAKGIHYCGSDSRSSRITIHKPTAKQYASQAGVPVIPQILLGPEDEFVFEEIEELLGQETIIKPTSEGSSRGLALIQSKVEWEYWLNENSPLKYEWLIERRVHGKELSVGILDDQALGVVEIRLPGSGVYDYEQKYHRNDTRYLCPAPITRELEGEIRESALKVFNACGCRDFARVDFLYDEAEKQLYFLEINTIPGMTPASLLPKSAAAFGYDFEQLILAMVKPCLERYRATKG